MSLLRSIHNQMMQPIIYSSDIAFREKIATHPNAEKCEKNDAPTCCEAIKARMLFVAQLIISVIALPIILIVGLISIAVRAFEGEAKEAFVELLRTLKLHIVVFIPTSAAGIFAPLKWTASIQGTLLNCIGSYDPRMYRLEQLDNIVRPNDSDPDDSSPPTPSSRSSTPDNPENYGEGLIRRLKKIGTDRRSKFNYQNQRPAPSAPPHSESATQYAMRPGPSMSPPLSRQSARSSLFGNLNSPTTVLGTCNAYPKYLRANSEQPATSAPEEHIEAEEEYNYEVQGGATFNSQRDSIVEQSSNSLRQSLELPEYGDIGDLLGRAITSMVRRDTEKAIRELEGKE